MICSVFGTTFLIIGLLFGITYGYFVKKLTANNERIVQMTLQNTEKDLKNMMAGAEEQLNRFSNTAQCWTFFENEFSNTIKKSILHKQIVLSFDQMLAENSNVYAFAMLSGDGRAVVSTAENKSRTGQMPVSKKLEQMMQECKNNYPFFKWYAGYEESSFRKTPLSVFSNRPVLYGMKALAEAEDLKDDVYLLVAIDENRVEKSYEQVIYNGSEAVLTNRENRIISATDKSRLGKLYEPDSQNQNIEYAIPYDGWRVINMIPKKAYLKEAHDLRNFGLVVLCLATIGIGVLGIAFGRRYTLPIQNLMEQMECVGKEQLDILPPQKAGLPELNHLNEEFYQTVQKLKNYIQRVQEVEQEKAKEELRALQYQINPHFLYNSLNSIRWLALMTNNNKVADSLVILSKIIIPILRDPNFSGSFPTNWNFWEII